MESMERNFVLNVKADKAIANIPVILLIKSADNESYLSQCGE